MNTNDPLRYVRLDTATVLKPGDRVLLTGHARGLGLAHTSAAKVMAALQDRFPGVEFTYLDDLQATVLPALEHRS